MVLKVRLCISVLQGLSDGCLGRLYGRTVLISWFHSTTIIFSRGSITETEEVVSVLERVVIVIKGLSRGIISTTCFSSLSENTSP